MGARLEPLFTGGALVLVLLLGAWLSPLSGEKYEWGQYALLGSAFPLLVLALADRGVESSAESARLKMRRALAFLLFGTVSFLARDQLGLLLLSCAGVQTALVVVRGRWTRPVEIAVLAWISVVGWIGAGKLVYWRSFWELPLSSAYKACLFAGFFFLTYLALFRPGPRPEKKLTLALDGVAILVFAAASLQVPSRHLAESAFHHWGFFAGPATQVRQGGFLLWDIPSPYGFLNILAAALFPAPTTWQSVHLLNGLFLFVCALVLHRLLRRSLTGVAGSALALLAVLAGMFMVPGWLSTLSGVSSYPSVGPYRFLWCYVSIAVLHATWLRQRAGRPAKGMWLLGCCVWLVGCLWSSESAVYCSVAWLPAYVLLVAGGSLPRDFARAAGWICLPILLLGLAVGAITVFYLARLGHPPDWFGYLEYSRSFASGSGSILVDRDGVVWELLILFAASATVLLRGSWAVLRPSTDANAGPALRIGALGMLWAVSSYFVARSHENNALNLVPLILACFAIVLVLLADSGASWMAACVKAAFLPALPVLLTVSFGDWKRLEDYLSRCGRFGIHDAIVPRAERSLQELLDKAGVEPSDPIVMAHPDLPPTMVLSGEEVHLPRAWLPGIPLSLQTPFRPERRQVYMARFVERTHLGGWMIVRKGRPMFGTEWILTALEPTYRMTDRFENEDWELRRYAPR